MRRADAFMAPAEASGYAAPEFTRCPWHLLRYPTPKGSAGADGLDECPACRKERGWIEMARLELGDLVAKLEPNAVLFRAQELAGIPFMRWRPMPEGNAR